MSKIIGSTVGMGLPKPNLMQDDPTKGDYVRGKEEFLAQAGAGSGQNVALSTAQINALDGMFQVCAFAQADVSAQYNAFRVAFGLGSTGGGSEGGDSGEGGGGDDSGNGEAGVSNETAWTDGVAYTFAYVDNSYISNTDGTFVDYNGWARTPYLYCAGASKLRFEVLADNSITNGTNNGYNAFYDANKNFIRAFSFAKIGTAGQTADVEIPSDAEFFIVSHKGSAIKTPYIKLIPCA